MKAPFYSVISAALLKTLPQGIWHVPYPLAFALEKPAKAFQKSSARMHEREFVWVWGLKLYLFFLLTLISPYSYYATNP